MERRFRNLVDDKRGNILTENVIFIILNIIFISILILFITSRTGNDALTEEKYAKQIALMIDSAKPGMEIHLNMEDAFESAEDNNFEGQIVSINNNENSVRVQLREKGSHSYHFFNNVSVSSYPDTSEEEIKDYVFIIGER